MRKKLKNYNFSPETLEAFRQAENGELFPVRLKFFHEDILAININNNA